MSGLLGQGRDGISRRPTHAHAVKHNHAVVGAAAVSCQLPPHPTFCGPPTLQQRTMNTRSAIGQCLPPPPTDSHKHTAYLHTQVQRASDSGSRKEKMTSGRGRSSTVRGGDVPHSSPLSPLPSPADPPAAPVPHKHHNSSATGVRVAASTPSPWGGSIRACSALAGSPGAGPHVHGIGRTACPPTSSC